ncbi:MAG: SurA N-terminal domain-containing protein [Rickettsiales bacterium]
MLESMRKIAGGVPAKILLVLLVISFGVWGVGDILRGSGAGYVAKVGGETISVGEFQQQQSRIARQMQAAGINIDASKIQLAVLRQLIQQKLVTHTVADAGLFVDDALVARALARDPQLQGLDGKFSDSAFHNMLREQGLNEPAFLAQMKTEIGGNFLLASLDMRDVSPPTSVLALAATIAGETRDAVLVNVTPGSIAAPTDAEIQQFYDDNASTLYQQPERRTFEFVTPSADDINALIDKTITNDMVRDTVATSPGMTPEKARQLLRGQQRDGALRELSNQVEDAMAAGASIGEAVAKAGLRAQSRVLSNVTVDQFTQTKDALSQTVTSQGFTLAEGEVSHLLTTPQGMYVFVGVKSITPAAPKPLAEVKADVTKQVAQLNARDAGRKRAAEIKEALQAGTNWQAVLNKFGAEGRMVRDIKRPKANANNEADLPPALAQAIFEQPVGKVAGPLARDNGAQQLAYILASHLPTTTPGEAAQATAAKSIGAELNAGVQAQAFDSMAQTQGIKVNKAAFAQGASQ